MKTSAYIVLLSLFCIFNTWGQTNEFIFYKTIQGASETRIEQNLIFFGKKFIGKPYIKKPLDSQTLPFEKKFQEVLVVNLKRFDCISFIEQSIAFAFTQEDAPRSFSKFKTNLQTIRYRNGVIEYSQRLHYFTDWVFEMEKKGLGKDITQEIGGEPYQNPVSMMTQKKELYQPMLQDTVYYNAIEKIETYINKRKHYYIPKQNIALCEKRMKTGDVIGITSFPNAGIDVLHTGFIIFQNERAYMLHASSELNKVMITDIPLETYLEEHKKFSGIIIMRVLSPKKNIRNGIGKDFKN
ncbi:MAG: DUF1460 domain-containing protein [Chitinophagaceae bacterium]|nr:DUF1460 domain-containing protein [Chitinophagaceae bacterium]